MSGSTARAVYDHGPEPASRLLNASTVSGLSQEMKRIQAGTRRTTVYSALLHAALLLFMIFHSETAPGPEVVTEILWVEPQEVRIAAAQPVIAPKPEKPLQSVQPKQQKHFERELRRAEVEPRPQSDNTIRDKLNERLVSLQESAVKSAALSPINVDVPAPNPPPLAAVETPGASPRELQRVETAKASPVELRRIQQQRPAPVAATAHTPAPSKPTQAENPDAVQNLAGMKLVGPVADRKVLSYATPQYPEWAKREAVEGSVRLYFFVLADGTIKENIMVQKTSGYEDFDRNAMAALKTWVFEPLGPGKSGEQWGEITFHYRLNGGE